MERSPLISPELESQLTLLLQKLTAPVELTCFAGTDEKSQEMVCFLNHLASLSPKLSCTFPDPAQELELADKLDVSLLPATGVAPAGEIPRMIFHGIPGGKEITAFAAAVLSAGQAAKPLDKPTLKDIGKLKKPMVLQVCVSLSCQHCAQLVAHAQRIAWENPLVTTHMIDANLYPQLVSAYNITRVPLTVIDGSTAIPSGKTMAALTTLLLKY